MPSAIVTGVAGGMGQAIAHALANAGLKVNGVDQAEAPADALDLQITGDVRDDAVIAQALDAALNGEDEVFLVNNAGITVPGSPQTKDAWEKTLDVNLSALFL